MKKYISTIVSIFPIIVSILVSIWYFYKVITYGHWHKGYLGDPLVLAMAFWLFIFFVISIGMFFRNSKDGRSGSSSFIIGFIILCLTAPITEHFYNQQQTAYHKFLDEKYIAKQSASANNVISVCNSKFKQPQKVLGVKDDNVFHLKLQDGDVSLLNLTPYSPQYDRLKEFSKTNIIGKNVIVQCPTYNDLISAQSLFELDLVNIPVVVFFEGKALNISPNVDFYENQGKEFAKHIKDEYLSGASLVTYTFRDDKVTFSIDYSTSLSISKKDSCVLFQDSINNSQSSICTIKPDLTSLPTLSVVTYGSNNFYKINNKTLLFIINGNIGLILRLDKACEKSALECITEYYPIDPGTLKIINYI